MCKIRKPHIGVANAVEFLDRLAFPRCDLDGWSDQVMGMQPSWEGAFEGLYARLPETDWNNLAVALYFAKFTRVVRPSEVIRVLRE